MAREKRPGDEGAFRQNGRFALLYLKGGMRDFNAKWRQGTGLSVCMECEMPKITIGIAGLRENLGRDVVIGEPV